MASPGLKVSLVSCKTSGQFWTPSDLMPVLQFGEGQSLDFGLFICSVSSDSFKSSRHL